MKIHLIQFLKRFGEPIDINTGTIFKNTKLIPILFNSKEEVRTCLEKYIDIHYDTMYKNKYYKGTELIRENIYLNWNEPINFKYNGSYYKYEVLYFEQLFFYSEYFKK